MSTTTNNPRTIPTLPNDILRVLAQAHFNIEQEGDEPHTTDDQIEIAGTQAAVSTFCCMAWSVRKWTEELERVRTRTRTGLAALGHNAYDEVDETSVFRQIALDQIRRAVNDIMGVDTELGWILRDATAGGGDFWTR